MLGDDRSPLLRVRVDKVVDESNEIDAVDRGNRVVVDGHRWYHFSSSFRRFPRAR